MMDLKSLYAKNILVVGVVRNSAKDIGHNVEVLANSLIKFSTVCWLLIESDSSDNTIEVLGEISKKVENFRFISQGALLGSMPSRTERIAYCRNIYLQEIKKNALYADIEYVVVSDFDDTNKLLTEEAILSCWDRNDWDVCTANQLGPYYDIWALRHPIWQPNDCWLEHRFLSQFSMRPSDLTYSCIFSKMIQLPTNSDWLEVDSAFGGLAVYRREVMCNSAYIGLYGNGIEVCEHVPFHLRIKENGGKIFINPRMVNTDYTEHSLPLKPHENSK
jgi:hypothetical protein